MARLGKVRLVSGSGMWGIGLYYGLCCVGLFSGVTRFDLARHVSWLVLDSPG